MNFNFTNFGFGELFKNSTQVDTTNTHHQQSIAKVSDFLSSLKIPRGQPIEFKSIPDLVGLEYVGYVMEKERFDLENNQWIRTDEFRFIGSKTNIFRDTRVAYGYTYRYRMKSVVKITTKREKDNLDNFLEQNLQKYAEESLDNQIAKKIGTIQQFQVEGNSGIEPKLSSGVASKTVSLSDNVQAKLQSDNNIVLTEVVKNNTGTVSQEQFNSTLFDIQKQNAKATQEHEYISMYYESNPGDWIIVDAVKIEPPAYPQNIIIFPNSTKKEMTISWLKPVSEVEVRFYNVYRRNHIGQPWEIIAEGLKEFETLFVDRNVGFDQKYIYAVTSIDVHGIESFLSIQIQVQLNSNIETEKKEKDLIFVSGGGVKPEEIDLVLKKFSQRKENLIARKNIVLKPNTRFREENKKFLIKITSLDTHEKIELVLTLQNNKEIK